MFLADVPIFDPATNVAARNRTRFANNAIPTALINPAAAAEPKFIPVPTNGSEVNNYTQLRPQAEIPVQYLGCVEQNLSSIQQAKA